MSPSDFKIAVEEQARNFNKEIEQHAKAAQAAVKEKGLDLHHVVERAANEGDVKEDGSTQKPSVSEVGKDLFDRW